MMRYGAGGVELWGSLCGALNGGLAAVALFVGDTPLRREMAGKLKTWYEKSELPTWEPETPLMQFPKKLPTSQADSLLCKDSIARWVSKSGYDAASPQRLDRCGRLSASAAAFVANLLNETLIEGHP